MNLPQPILDFCLHNGWGPIRRATPLGGGCINNAARLDTDGGPLFLKVNDTTPPDMFEREAEGLIALAVPGGPRVPKVLLVGRDFILQEYIEPGPSQGGQGDRGDRKGRPYWETLGRQMAALHNHTAPRFGFPHDNYIGPTPQPNTWEDGGHTFFAEHRLRYQANLAHRNRLLDSTNLQS
jgi:fructosamine-3-kinase